jgi:phosphatidate cytidylyltransferase
MLKQRVITALVMMALFLAALFALPSLGWSVLALAVVMLGAFEWGRLAKLSGSGEWIYLGLTFAVMAGLIGYGLAGGEHLLPLQMSIYALSALFWLAVALPWLLLGWHVRQPVALALIGWVVLIPAGLAMIDLRAMSPWLLLFIMALVWIADIAAFFSGKKFGKRKLAPSISPGKTWEGVVGAILGVTCYVAFAGWGSGRVHDLGNLFMLILISWLWVAFSIEGDLFESAIKRQAGVKDSGALLPGHGGVLDRIDALTSTLPLAVFALLLVKILKVVG